MTKTYIILHAHRRTSKLLTSHSICDQFPLLKAFKTNTLNYHKYLKEKLSSHEPSNLHNSEVPSSLRLSAILLLLLINFHLEILTFMFRYLFMLLSKLIQDGVTAAKPTLSMEQYKNSCTLKKIDGHPLNYNILIFFG